MTVAVSTLVIVMVVWGLSRLASHHRGTRSPRGQNRRELALSELDALLRDLAAAPDTRCPRQELAAVRGRAPRRHVWCAPGGEEVFLN